MAATKKRTPRETWEAIEQQARDDEIERFLAMPKAEVDARLREAGHDPDAVRKAGTDLAAKLMAERDKRKWQFEAAEGLAGQRAHVEARTGRYAGVPRTKLLELLAIARANPRLAQPVAVMFRNRKTEEASEDEIRAILEEIDSLAEREPDR